MPQAAAMMAAMSTLREPARDIPITATCDLVVVGGSCTGVFAAVAAARLGLKVCLVEQLNQFGGTATASMVCVWHALWNTTGTQQIASGLTSTVIDRLRRRGAVIEGERTSPHWQYCFRPAELAIELDELVLEHGIRPFLHARVASVVREGGQVTAVVIEDKDGRRAISTRAVVDASGDADVLRRAGVDVRRPDPLQPPTTAAMLCGLEALRREVPGFQLGKTLFDASNPKALRSGFVWAAPQPGIPGMELVFGTRVHGADLLQADDLTRAEMAGRTQVRRMVDLLREAYPQHPVSLAAIPARIGIRETCHARCLYTLTEQEVLDGVPAADAIAYGSYRVDIHPQGGGIVFRYLNGRESRQDEAQQWHEGRWREQRSVDPTFYQIPYRCLVPRDLDNVLVAGRCLDADQGAYGAVRVMMVCNQLGEAAGTAAALALRQQTSMAAVDTAELRRTLATHGATII
jgi:hypothetical protein